MSHKSPTKSAESKSFNAAKAERQYTTKLVDSSLALLGSPEDDVVLEALLYLTKYADLHENNLNCLYQRGLLQRLLNLFDRNVCILRLMLRLLGVLLTMDEVVTELNQDSYNEKVVKISSMYITHDDAYVRHFCVSVLSKLTKSCRITCLIFEIDLFDPILDTIQNTTDMLLLEWTLELFLKLLTAPAAMDVLPMIYNFDSSILLIHLGNSEHKICSLSFEIIQKLTFYCLDVFQRMFREAKLIETMFEIIMTPEKEEYHDTAFEIICNSMKSAETSTYFIESVEFLKFCQWVKTCNKKYLLRSITILEPLTKIPSRRQMLFDLSVEESILTFLRSSDKKVLIKTCEAISNMTAHKYCCDHMLTPAILKQLFQILFRKDEEDPSNETALKTIINFNRKSLRTAELIYTLGVHKVLLGYFKKGIGFISEESFLGLLEILYKMSMHPLHQQDIISTSFFQILLNLFLTAPTDTATFVLEILTNFIESAEFRRIFLALKGPQVVVDTLQSSNNLKLLKNILIFIYENLPYENMVISFLQVDLLKVLKEFPELLKVKAPLAVKVLKLLYNIYLPLKFFDTNKLDVTDKLGNKFYLITGQWKDPFPFIETLEASQPSTSYTVYVVDYSVEVSKYAEESSETLCTNKQMTSERTLSIVTKFSSSNSSCTRQGQYLPNYGKLSADPFLPRYVQHVSKFMEDGENMEEKIKILAEYVDALLCGPTNGYTKLDKIHNLKLHLECLKNGLGTSMIPIGFLKLGFSCERALFFKALADKCSVPASLIKGEAVYWNEVPLLDSKPHSKTVRMYAVDLMNNIGNLLVVGSRAANQYCNIKT